MNLTRQDIADLIELAQLGCRTRRERQFVQDVAAAIQTQWRQEAEAQQAAQNAQKESPSG